MSQKARMTVSLDPEIHEQLVTRARREGRTPGNLASFLLSLAIEKDLDLDELEVLEQVKSSNKGKSRE